MEAYGLLFFSVFCGLALCVISTAILLPISYFAIRQKKYGTLTISFGILMVVWGLIFFMSESRLINGLSSGPSTPAFEPRNEDVVGTWQLSDSTVNYLQRDGYTVRSHQLAFHADGTFNAVNIPYLTEPLEASQQSMKSAESGIWKIGKDTNGAWAVIVYFQTDHETTHYAYLDFEESERPYTLRLWTGEMGGLVFARQ